MKKAINLSLSIIFSLCALLTVPSEMTASVSDTVKVLGAGYVRGLGDAVSISGNMALVGAPDIDAAFIFTNTGGNTWVEHAKLVPPTSSDRFGTSVYLSGNVALIGAVQEGSGTTYGGAAYIFSTSGGNTWTQQARLAANTPGYYELLGTSVSMSGNLVILGGQAYSGAEHSGGIAYIFANTSGNTWVEHDNLLPPILHQEISLVHQ